jgi:acetolactate synthase-1/2/3 large subunit
MERISDHIFNFLKEIGVEHVFVVPGGAAMYLVDSLGKSGIPYTACLHEFSAGMAAMAYAQYTGKLTVCLVTNGPGALNAINACAAANIDGAPVLFISGQCKSTDMMGDDFLRSKGQQEVDVLTMVNTITKYSQLISYPDGLVFLPRAVKHAMEGKKGPVWLEIPVDVQARMCERPGELFPRKPFIEEDDHYIDARKIADALFEAERPIILVGHGVMDSGARDDMMRLIEAMGIPFMTTWRAAEFCDEWDPYYVGRPGNVGQRAANMILQKCDLLITIGARLDPETVAYDFPNFAKNAKRIVIDIDKYELNKHTVDLSIDANAKNIIDSISKLLVNSGFDNLPSWDEWCADCNYLNELFRNEVVPVNPGFVSHYDLLDVLSDIATKDDVIVPGSAGPCMYRFFQKWRVKYGQRIFVSAGLQSMGSAIPMAMGAAIASGKRVISVVGDGGFQMSVHTLATIAKLGLNIKFFVLDNGGFNAIKGMQDYYFEGRYVATTPDSGLSIPPSNRIAYSYGVNATVMNPGDDITKLMRYIFSNDAPHVCSVVSDIDEFVSPRVRAKIMPDGSMKSMGIENMWPFLSEEKLEELMK